MRGTAQWWTASDSGRSEVLRRRARSAALAVTALHDKTMSGTLLTLGPHSHHQSVPGTPSGVRASNRSQASTCTVQGYLAYNKTPTPLGTPWDPRHRPTVGS